MSRFSKQGSPSAAVADTVEGGVPVGAVPLADIAARKKQYEKIIIPVNTHFATVYFLSNY